MKINAKKSLRYPIGFSVKSSFEATKWWAKSSKGLHNYTVTMKTKILLSVLIATICLLSSCEKEMTEAVSKFQELEKTMYFDAEIFSDADLKIYGSWKLFDVSGGFSGGGHDLNFEYLEIKKYGVYGFVRNDSLVEFGKIAPAAQTANDILLKVDFEKDENSNAFFSDTEKYVEFAGNDTLHLYSPCCDRYDYHFKRVKQ